MLGGGGIVRPPCTVRYRPLGSPWSTLEVLYATAEYVVRVVRWVGTGGGVVPGVVRAVGYREGAIPGTQPGPTREPVIGIARAQPVARPDITVSPGHSRALQALPHTLAPAPVVSPS